MKIYRGGGERTRKIDRVIFQHQSQKIILLNIKVDSGFILIGQETSGLMNLAVGEEKTAGGIQFIILSMVKLENPFSFLSLFFSVQLLLSFDSLVVTRSPVGSLYTLIELRSKR